METMDETMTAMGGTITDMRMEFEAKLNQILTLLGKRNNVDAGEGQERRPPGDDT